MSEEIKKGTEKTELDDQALSEVNGGTCSVYEGGGAGLGEYYERFQHKKSPSFEASNYVKGILKTDMLPKLQRAL